jgi:hypothetical protein
MEMESANVPFGRIFLREHPSFQNFDERIPLGRGREGYDSI